MINPFKDTNWNPDRKALRRFSVSLIVGLPLVAAWFAFLQWWRTDHVEVTAFAKFAAAGVLLGGVTWLFPALARPVYRIWYAIACSIGMVVGNTVLALLYYLFVTPLGLVRRAVWGSPVRRVADRSVNTCWSPAEPKPPLSRYFRQF